MASLTKHVKLVEVSPRDGLQNESVFIPTPIKIAFIEQLANTGLTVIETTSFVSPHKIPQLADHAAVFSGIHKQADVHYPVLVPNLKGMEQALQVGVKEIAVFIAASETFSHHNIGCTINDSLKRCAAVIQLATQNHITVRGYISCVLGCPYEGVIAVEKVLAIADHLFQLGCYEISLGDTIGVGTPNKVIHLIRQIRKKIPIKQLAVHFHDTYGQALANIYAALLEGVSIIDSAVGGLGGCPYAPGAAGNVATETVVYLLNGLGITSGVDLNALYAVKRYIKAYIKQSVKI